MNPCCKHTLQDLQSYLHDIGGALLKASGDGQTVMEKALRQRAETVVDIMGVIKEWANHKAAVQQDKSTESRVVPKEVKENR